MPPHARRRPQLGMSSWHRSWTITRAGGGRPAAPPRLQPGPVDAPGGLPSAQGRPRRALATQSGGADQAASEDLGLPPHPVLVKTARTQGQNPLDLNAVPRNQVPWRPDPATAPNEARLPTQLPNRQLSNSAPSARQLRRQATAFPLVRQYGQEYPLPPC